MTLESQAIHAAPDAGFDFDPAALKAKYLAERDKRLRADANEQYVEMTGASARYLEAPYIDQPLARPAPADEKYVGVIGGGFAGPLAGAGQVEEPFDERRDATDDAREQLHEAVDRRPDLDERLQDTAPDRLSHLQHAIVELLH